MARRAARTVAEDTLLGGRVRLRQPARGYRAAIDPVLLAAAVPAAPASRVLDLGCGAGAAAFCLLARVPEARVTGWEIQADLARLACENAALNGCGQRFSMITGDLAERRGVAPGGYDEVMCNPPHQPAAATPAPDPGKRRATREQETPLAAWIAAALYHLKPKGGLTFVHRADRLDDLLAALRGRAGGLLIFPLWPGAGRPAKRVLLRARKGVRSPLALAAGLRLHEADGRYTAAAEAVLRDGLALALSAPNIGRTPGTS